MINSRQLLFILIAGLAMTALGILTAVHHYSKNRTVENKQAYELREVNAVLPFNLETEPDSSIVQDIIYIEDETTLSAKETLMVFRQRQEKNIIGTAIAPIIAKGYNGNIKLCVGLNPDNTISAIRVISHNETEQIGAQIHQDYSDWLKQFNGYSINSKKEDWQLIRDAGKIDGISGATITSRAVLNALHDAVQFYATRKDINQTK